MEGFQDSVPNWQVIVLLAVFFWCGYCAGKGRLP